MIDVSNRDTANAFANELYIISLDILNDHDSLFGEEVKGKFVGCVLQDAFLNQQDISTRSHNLLDHICYNFSLLSHNSVDCLVILDDD